MREELTVLVGDKLLTVSLVVAGVCVRCRGRKWRRGPKFYTASFFDVNVPRAPERMAAALFPGPAASAHSESDHLPRPPHNNVSDR